jgi:hypothetical protein
VAVEEDGGRIRAGGAHLAEDDRLTSSLEQPCVEAGALQLLDQKLGPFEYTDPLRANARYSECLEKRLEESVPMTRREFEGASAGFRCCAS